MSVYKVEHMADLRKWIVTASDPQEAINKLSIFEKVKFYEGNLFIRIDLKRTDDYNELVKRIE
jgi:hypothetical protein